MSLHRGAKTTTLSEHFESHTAHKNGNLLALLSSTNLALKPLETVVDHHQGLAVSSPRNPNRTLNHLHTVGVVITEDERFLSRVYRQPDAVLHRLVPRRCRSRRLRFCELGWTETEDVCPVVDSTLIVEAI
jgi:hypothetical protein